MNHEETRKRFEQMDREEGSKRDLEAAKAQSQQGLGDARVTLAIAERSVEAAFCEGYRTAFFDFAAVFIAALLVYTFASIFMVER